MLCRHKTRAALFCLAVLFLFSDSGSCQESTLRQLGQQNNYNILFLALDDLRPELGCYGAEYVKSPNIDRIASEGMTFIDAHCQQAICNPSRASLLTGRYPDEIQVWDLPTKFRETAGGANVVTLPQFFKQHDYHTSWTGKIFHPGHDDDRSWSEPVGLHRNKEMPRHRSWRHYSRATLQKYARLDREFRTEHGRKARWTELWPPAMEAVADASDGDFSDAVMADHAIDKLRMYKQSGQRFFLAVGMAGTHLPFTAPKKYFDLYDPSELPLPANSDLPAGAPPMALNTAAFLRAHDDLKVMALPAPQDGVFPERVARELKRAYLATVSFLDTQIGRVIDELDRLGLTESTIICVWGDHGWKLGEHRGWSKMTNFDVDTRCPLIISHPDMQKKGMKCDAVVELVDIYPTLADLAGLKMPANVSGESLLPLMSDPDADWNHVAMSQYLRGGMKPESYDGKEYMGYSVKTKEFRYTEWFTWDKRMKSCGALVAKELYDHRQNHFENVNLFGRKEFEGVAEEMAILLKKKRGAVNTK